MGESWKILTIGKLTNFKLNKLVKYDRDNFPPYILVILKEACKKNNNMIFQENSKNNKV